MSNFSLTGILISVIVIGVMISGIAVLVTDYSTTYGYTPDMTFNASFNKLADGANLSSQVLGSVQPSDSIIGQFMDFIYASTFGVIFQVLRVTDIFNSMFTDITTYLGIPSFFLTAILAILGLMIAFKIIEMILRPYMPF